MSEKPTYDPRETPGSYTKTRDGSFKRTDKPQREAEASAPELPRESAQAIADALTDLGHDLPPAVEAAIGAPSSPTPAPATPAAAPPKE